MIIRDGTFQLLFGMGSFHYHDLKQKSTIMSEFFVIFISECAVIAISWEKIMVRTQTGRMNFSPEIDRGGAYLPYDPFSVCSFRSNLLTVCRISVNSRISYLYPRPFPCSFKGRALPFPAEPLDAKSLYESMLASDYWE